MASVDKKDVTKNAAEQALKGLKDDLTAGIGWHKAYGKAAELLPDKEGPKKLGGGWTHLCYCYDGVISPTGFDLLTRSISDRLDPTHVQNLFEAKTRVHRMDTETAYFVYYVEAFND